MQLRNLDEDVDPRERRREHGSGKNAAVSGFWRAEKGRKAGFSRMLPRSSMRIQTLAVHEDR